MTQAELEVIRQGQIAQVCSNLAAMVRIDVSQPDVAQLQDAEIRKQQEAEEKAAFERYQSAVAKSGILAERAVCNETFVCIIDCVLALLTCLSVVTQSCSAQAERARKQRQRENLLVNQTIAKAPVRADC